RRRFMLVRDGFGSFFTPKRYPRENSKGTHNRAVMRDHGHNFASKRLTLARRCERHQNSGLSILAAAIEAVIRSVIGPNPPPTRRRMMESRIRTTAPCLF